MRVALAILLALFAFLHLPELRAQVESPEAFLGFEVGADQRLFDWNKIHRYFQMLDEASDRVRVLELGESTLGQPFLMAILSSSHNLKNLTKYRNLQAQAASARHLSDGDARLLAHQNKAVVMILLNTSSTEVASSQLSVELAYRLATDRSPAAQQIRDHLIVLLVPSTNPDGLKRTVEWYKKYAGTPHEASPLPRLSHPYAGDEHKEDWLVLNLIESRLLAKQFYHEWFPVLVYEQHESAAQGARLQLASAALSYDTEPFDRASPAGATFIEMVMDDLGDRRIRGLSLAAGRQFETAGMASFVQHNMLCIYSQAASAQLATPVFFPRGSLSAESTPSISNPWPGGWWRMRDVIDYEMAAILAVLHTAAGRKERLIYDFCRRNMAAIRTGATEPPFAYIVPLEQHDAAAARQLINILIQNGVEVQRTQTGLEAGGKGISSGDYVILLSQSYGRFVRTVFGALLNHGATSAPASAAASTFSLPLIMGVRIAAIDSPFVAELSPVKSARTTFRRLVSEKGGDYLISHSSNRSFIAMNRLLKQGKKVFWLENKITIAGKVFQPGTIYVPGNELHADKMDLLGQELSIEIVQTRHAFGGETALRIRPPKIGLHQPWTAEPDEGWTRFLLEKYEFPFETVFNVRIRKRNLKGNFDVLILTDMEPARFINGLRRKAPNAHLPKVPRSYLNGISEVGIENIREFVMKGGTLITLGRACNFAVEHLGLPVKTTLRTAGNSHAEGRNWHTILVDRSEPVAYGMPSTATAALENSPVFQPGYWSRRTGVVAYFQANSLLNNGLKQAGALAGRSAILDVPMGDGRVVLIGIRAQHRAQTLGTFKFLFNAILLGRTEAVTL